jgi:hypothetical protein
MALHHSPKITTDGLVLALDAGDLNSYPGSGTVWYDLSGNGNHGTLVNGPTFTSANSGSIILDGSNDYISIPNNSTFNVTDNISVELWVKLETSQANNLGFLRKYVNGYLFYVTPDANRNFAFDSRNGDGTYYRTTGTTNIQDGIWKYLVAQKIGISYKVYVNGVLEGSVNAATVGDISSDATLFLGTDNGTYLNGRIGSFKLYNRAISQSEITQNFNAHKKRFGL